MICHKSIDNMLHNVVKENISDIYKIDFLNAPSKQWRYSVLIDPDVDLSNIANL